MMLQPKDITALYYRALYSGDLDTVRSLMSPTSYSMTLETFGLRLSLRDPDFKKLLKEREVDPDALTEVESKLSLELISRALSPLIEIRSIQNNGDKRQIIEYEEDGKSKKLYFSKEEEGWKIDYFAGRKVD